ncbi:class I SAM-dependent methyltransferase [Ideonella sp. 4Y16]|uniref:class I SAM-dependent methyltransferase n=1 Tax=Ideonella alba TaxID=2824118 RepID=UPI001B36BB79|nr:class I SAM-dependent methyltransferase [Ideonella alba]MBQ0941866.1 class I SAM-dependent methyltransferase [Ideonella alba]
MSTPPDDAEARALRERYARRAPQDPRYALTNPAALWPQQERQRALVALLRRHGWADPSACRLHEVGCGHGGNLLEALQLGFQPALLSGTELLAERFATARERLPSALTLWRGDARHLGPAPASVDVVMQSTVFSSLLDDTVQQQLAQAMWAQLRPGGAVLWYDFTVNNPRNPDVRGVPLARVRALFPQGRIDARRVTLAPPIARAAARWHPSLYTVLNALPPLRTHLLAWIAKPA